MGFRVQIGGYKTLEDYCRVVQLTTKEAKEIFTYSDSGYWNRRYTAQRIYARYMKQAGGIPYALRFKALCKKWGIEV